MNEFIEYFKVKKNLINLLTLLIMVLGIPLGVNLAKERQLFQSQAGTDAVQFKGANVKERNGKKVATSPTVDLVFTSTIQTNTQSSSNRNTSLIPASFGVFPKVKAQSQCDESLAVTYDAPACLQDQDDGTSHMYWLKRYEDGCEIKTGPNEICGCPADKDLVNNSCVDKDKSGQDCTGSKSCSDGSSVSCHKTDSSGTCNQSCDECPTRPANDCDSPGQQKGEVCTVGGGEGHQYCKHENDDTNNRLVWGDCSLENCPSDKEEKDGQCVTKQVCERGTRDSNSRQCIGNYGCKYRIKECKADGTGYKDELAEETNCALAPSACNNPNPPGGGPDCTRAKDENLKCGSDNHIVTRWKVPNGCTNEGKLYESLTSDKEINTCADAAGGKQDPFDVVAANGCYICDTASDGKSRLRASGDQTDCDASGVKTCPEVGLAGNIENLCKSSSDMRKQLCTPAGTGTDKCFVCQSDTLWHYKSGNANAVCGSSAKPCSAATKNDSECKGAASLLNQKCDTTPVAGNNCYFCEQGKGLRPWGGSCPSNAASSCSSSIAFGSYCKGPDTLPDNTCGGTTSQETCYFCEQGKGLRPWGGTCPGDAAAACSSTIAFGGYCKGPSSLTDNTCGGSSASPSPAIPPVTTTDFRFAESEADLAAAQWRPYTGSSVTVAGYTFSNTTKGSKFIVVEFKSSTGNTKKEGPFQVDYVGPDAILGGVSCTPDLAGEGLTVNVAGSDFGTAPGQATLDSKPLEVDSWEDRSIVFRLPKAPDLKKPKTLAFKMTRSDGQSLEGSCKGNVSQLNVGAKFFCRMNVAHSQENVELVLVRKTNNAYTDLVEKKVSIDASGNILGFDTTQLEVGGDYRICLKAPAGLRGCQDFVAQKGTTIINNFTLALGDIFPISGGKCIGDGKVNSGDKAELNREWGLSKNDNKCGDFDKNGKVNNADWACMVLYFNRTDDEKPKAVSVPAAAVNKSKN